MSVWTWNNFSSVQFSPVAHLCPTLCDPMNRSTPSLPVHHHLPEFTQTHVHRVCDAIQPSHPQLSFLLLPPILPSIRVFPMSQLFAWGGQSTGVTNTRESKTEGPRREMTTQLTPWVLEAGLGFWFPGSPTVSGLFSSLPWFSVFVSHSFYLPNPFSNLRSIKRGRKGHMCPV